MLNLKNPAPLRQQAYVAGQWVYADSGETRPVTNPATGEVIGTIPFMGEAETRRAIDAAEVAMKAWKLKTGKERSIILRRWFDLMMANQKIWRSY